MESDGERFGMVCQDHRVHRAERAIIEEWDGVNILVAAMCRASCEQLTWVNTGTYIGERLRKVKEAAVDDVNSVSLSMPSEHGLTQPDGAMVTMTTGR